MTCCKTGRRQATTIIVRPAKDGEGLKTLDGQGARSRRTRRGHGRAIAAAGWAGWKPKSLRPRTCSRSASFDFVSIRRTAHRFVLFSEASTRFSRGVHPELVLPAAQHAAKLMEECAGGQVLKGVVDNYPAPLPTQVVTLKRSEIRRLLGIDFPDAEIERVLTALQFSLLKIDDGWKVTVPLTRLDIQAGAADLIEELARIHGYDRPRDAALRRASPQRNNRRSCSKIACRRSPTPAQECVTYSLASKEQEAKLGVAEPWWNW